MRRQKRRSAMLKKIVVMFAAVVLIVAATIGGTLAWLTAETQAVTNTFTVGNISIDLKEKDYVPETDTEASKLVNTTTKDWDDKAKWVTENKDYKVVPGGTDPKEPVIKVGKGSEKCYVYALVENGLVISTTTSEGESESQTYKNVCAIQLDTNTSWASVGSVTENGVVYTLYKYNDEVNAFSEDKFTSAVFTSVKYSADITKGNIEQLKDKTIKVYAYAHQSENFSDVNVATNNAITWANGLMSINIPFVSTEPTT